MKDRTLAVIITVLVVILCGCPGLLFLCNGLFALIEILTNYQVQLVGYGYNAPYWLAASACVGIVAIVITVLVSYFVLRQRGETPPPPPPTTPQPPEPPQEPIPPTI